MKYLIVDDEPITHQIIDSYCHDLPEMEKAGGCHDALEALYFLKESSVDVMFLDLNMPKLGGFEFLRALDKPPAVIVISAHAEHALEGFELNVVDYLLKPFSLQRFQEALAKVDAVPANSTEAAPETIFLKDGKKHHQVSIAEIVYVEACGNYSMVYLEAGKIMTQIKISDLAARLPGVLLRVHKSFMVAPRKIQVIEAGEIKIAGRNIPIGRTYKAEVNQLLG